MASALRLLPALCLAAALTGAALVAASNETTTAAQTTPFPGVSSSASQVKVAIQLSGNYSAITNTSAFGTEIEAQLASRMAVNTSQVQNLTVSTGITVEFDIVTGGGSSPATALKTLNGLVTAGGLYFTSTALGNVTANSSYVHAYEVTNAAATTTAAAATTTATNAATTATNAATTATNAATTATNAATTATNAATTTTTAAATTTTAAYPGVSNSASTVTAQIELIANYSAISSNTSAFITELKPQLATQLNMTESQITDVQLSSGSIIVKFTILAGSGSSSSPANALAKLKTLVNSGSLSISSTSLGNITANSTYMVAFEVTTAGPTTTPTAAPTTAAPITCYKCNGTLCDTYQKSCDARDNCTSGQACWIDRVRTTTGTYHRRYCGVACTSTYTSKYCITTSTQQTCRKCCSTANCNVEVLTASVARLSASAGLLLASLLLGAAILRQGAAAGH